jgi:hypothetical protein
MVFDFLPVSGPTGAAAIALVTALIVVRFYAGARLLDPKHMTWWGIARRVFMPLIDRLAKRTVGISAENQAHKEEEVAMTPADPVDVRDALIEQSGERWEVSVLSGLKTDWTGKNKEIASLVCYHGGKPAPGAPDWLRDKQTHVFMFSLSGVGTRVCAHEEANSWRPDQWRDHLYKGDSFDVEAGKSDVTAWLEESDVTLSDEIPQ